MRSALALVLGFCFFAGSRPELPRSHHASITAESAVAHANLDGIRLLAPPAIASFTAPILPSVELPRAGAPITSSTPVYLRQLVLLL